jgi:hypothetical protein
MNDRYTILLCFNDFLDALKHKDYLYDESCFDNGYKKMLCANIKYCLEQQCNVIKEVKDNQEELDKQKEILLYMRKEVKALKL